MNIRMVSAIKTLRSVTGENLEFNRILLEVIDESFNRVLGETATQTIYFHLEQKHHLKREDIPDNLEDFLFPLERIFGIGALIIEKTIMEGLYSQLRRNKKSLRLKYKDKEHFNFINYITDLRCTYLKQATNTPCVHA